jgi:4,5-DOPA dioxygenase extradiol
MQRKDFLKTFALIPLVGTTMSLNELDKLISPDRDVYGRMPALFVGHGSPMNAIEENSFTKSWKQIGTTFPRPSAILCISAHWETKGTFVTVAEHPRTIHDFYGFPDKLFSVQYPAPGNPQIAGNIIETVINPKVKPDAGWGLDHGTWSVLKHIYPEADVPVLQLSLDHTMKPGDHYLLSKQLKKLRQQGVLILGSGNIVHNLRQIDWKKPDHGHEWAEEANDQIKRLIISGDYLKLTNYDLLGKAIQLSIATPEHFLPLLYILALAEPDDVLSFFNDSCVYGSISMTSLRINT